MDDATPIPADFAAWLRKTPPAKRRGLVATAPNKFGVTMPVEKASDRISQLGVAANIAFGDGEYATAHDIRRAYGTRWAKVVRPATLQRMMRHATFRSFFP